MATLSTTRNYADGEILTQADLDAFLSDIETFVNVTKLNDDNLQDNGITASLKLVNATVTAAKLGPSAVTTIKIADANVTTAKLADGAVTTAKITDANVTTAKLADSAVTAAKIADGTITAAKLAGGVKYDVIATTLTTTGAIALTADLVRVSTGSAFTATIDTVGGTPSAYAGKRIKILKSSSDFNACTIATAGGETIGGAATTTVNTIGESVELEFDGTSDWIIVRRAVPSIWSAATFGVTGGYTGITSQASYIKRDGDTLHCKVSIVLSGSSAATGTITLPTGISIDTGKAGAITLLGEWKGLRLNNNFLNAGGPGGSGAVGFATGTPTAVYAAITGTGSGFTGITVNSFVSGGDAISLDFTIPVSGWNS